MEAPGCADAVATVHAAIEIVDSRIADWKITFADTVADNGSSAFFVLAEEGRPLAGLRFTAKLPPALRQKYDRRGRPTAKRAEPLMEGRNGSILTMSYYGAEKVVPNYNVMGVAKAALESATRYLANDLGPQQVRVNAISPGPMKTLAGAAIGGARATFRHTEANAPMRSNATLEAIGGTAVWLCSDYGNCTSGEVIHVDCGFHVLGMPQQENL